MILLFFNLYWLTQGMEGLFYLFSLLFVVGCGGFILLEIMRELEI